MKKKITTLFIITALCFLNATLIKAQINEQDSLALADLYNSTNGPHWIKHTNWLTIAPVSTWYGIKVTGSRVTQINLSGDLLNGNIPPSFANLTALRSLNLNSNKIYHFPSFLSTLTTLENLELVGDSISGSIPSSLSNLINLKVLYLTDNQFSGGIPSSFGELTNLDTLELSYNQLTGKIPAQLNKLTHLKNLFLSNNQLSGPIPDLDKLSNLKRLGLDANAFTFAGMEDIATNFRFANYSPQANVKLNNSNNILSVSVGGTLSHNTYKWYKDDVLYKTNTGDSTLTINGNGTYYAAITNSVAKNLTLYSEAAYIGIPPVSIQDSLALVALYDSTEGYGWNDKANWLTNAPVLRWSGIKLSADGKRVKSVYLNSNGLSGKLPNALGNLTALQALSLNENNLASSIPGSLGNLKNLTHLDLSHNNLKQHIPASLGKLVNLKYLNLSYNQLSDSIRSSLGNLINLQTLDLSFNGLSGSIPASLGNLINLQTLYISENHLSGKIPPELGNLANVSDLWIRDNYLSGTIPSTFSKLYNLFDLNLSNNKLSGNIPSVLGNLPRLFSLVLNKNKFSGSIPSSLGNLFNLHELNLSDNELSGSIPSSLANPPYIVFLILSGNSLTGKIPESFSNLHWQFLSLDHNKLSGVIPAIKVPATTSSELHLEYNNFTFAGMTKLVQDFPNAYYSPQANIKLNRRGNVLSVYGGGANALAENTYKWYKGSTLVATINGDSTYQPILSGNYSVAVTNSVATALTLYSDTVYYNAGSNAIAAKLNNNSSIFIYPNPAKTNATLSFSTDGKYAITITNVSGKILQTKIGVALKGENTIQLDVSKYANGIYSITIIDEKNKKQTVRLNKE